MVTDLDIDPHVDSIVMPENLKVGMMVAAERRKCEEMGIQCNYTDFAFGQSPFPVPGPLRKALADHADKGHYSVADGIPELREAIAHFNKRHFGLDVDPSRVVVGTGTKGLIFTIFTMINGHVIIPSPSWVGYFPQLKLLGKHYHILYTKPERDYRMQAEDLEQLLLRLSHEKKQHLLVLNNPHNPTGILYSKEELTEIADVCKRHNTFILADEIYALSTYQFEQFTSMGLIYPEASFVLNGLSKDRSAGGYRLGACILPAQQSNKLKLDFNKIAATVYTNVTTPIQFAAQVAYEPSPEIEEYFIHTREIHSLVGGYMCQEFNKIDGIKTTTPQGSFYFFADFNELADDLRRHGIPNSNELGQALLAHPHHVATITGDSLILMPDDYGARISFVDYDGKKALESYKNNPPQTPEEVKEFVREHAPNMIRGLSALRSWVEGIRK
ncbi:aminotransferase class I/II-fold pyridoxal phosphate-dependent enzyme [Thermodesulfobacteriota bacterium]